MDADTVRVLEALEEQVAASRPCALATVVGVRGSTYRKMGAKVLVREDFTTVGTISGGCVEGDIAMVAREVLASGHPCVVSYDLQEDDVCSLGVGCGGAIEVLVEPLWQGSSEGDSGLLLEALRALYHEQRTQVVATPLPETFSKGAVRRWVVRPDGTMRGSGTEPAADTAVSRSALEVMTERASSRRVLALGDKEVTIFFDLLAPPPRVLLHGAGDDAIPLVRILRELGFRITVADPRAAYNTKDRFPGADALLVASPEEAARAVSLSEGDFVIIMHHHKARDRDALRTWLHGPTAYVGVLGPRQRTEQLLAELKEDGFTVDAQDLRRIHAPVGLDIGAEGAGAVAVSIAAEIVAFRTRHPGGHLRDRRGPIHLLRERTA